MSDPWQEPPATLKLSPRFIDIWRIPLNLPKKQINRYLSILPDEERKRAANYKSAKRLNEFVITRGLTRLIIARYLDITPDSFSFDYAEHDKPFLPVATLGIPIAFNVTHSHNLGLIAVSMDCLVGIDLEFVRHDIEFKKLAGRFFSRQEARCLENYSIHALPAAFFACWTRKEAFVKALGDGISFGLSEFSVSVDPGDDKVSLITHWDADEGYKWSLVNLQADKDYIAALATDNNKFRIRLWDGRFL